MLVRSPTNNIMGLHLQDNKDPQRILAVNAKNYTVLDGESIMPYIRENISDAVFCYRLMQVDPIDWSAQKHNGRGQAQKALAVFNRTDNFGRPLMTSRDFFTPANEMNLALEKGNNTIDMQRIYYDIAQWSYDFADEWRRLGAPCGIVSPALSPGHSEDQEDEPGIIGFEILKDAWNLYDLIGVHCYWEAVGSPSLTDVNGLAKFYAFRNVDTYRRYWPDKDCWEGEWNTGGWVFDPTKWQAYANECDWYLRQLATRPWVRAATHFIFDSWDQPYQISKAEPVYQRFVSIGHEFVESGSEQPPIIVPPVNPPPVETPMPVNQDLLITIGGKPASFQQAFTKYPGLAIINGDRVVVTTLNEVHQDVMCHAVGPEDMDVSLYPTGDGPGSVNGRTAKGFVEVQFAHESQAQFPEAVGPWTAACGDARVTGLGMAWLTDHDHFNVVFAKRVPVDVPPVPVPTVHSKADELGVYPVWVNAMLHNEPNPTLEMMKDRERFHQYLIDIFVPEPDNLARYGWVLD